MPSTPPSPANDYQIPLGQFATREFLQGIFSSIGERLRAAEATEADYQDAIDLITTQALAVVSANVADEVEAQRANLAAIQQTLDALLAEYEAVQTGGVPAAGIAVTAIAGLAGTNVQAVLQSIRTVLVAIDTAVSSKADAAAIATAIALLAPKAAPSFTGGATFAGAIKLTQVDLGTMAAGSAQVNAGSANVYRLQQAGNLTIAVSGLTAGNEVKLIHRWDSGTVAFTGVANWDIGKATIGTSFTETTIGKAALVAGAVYEFVFSLVDGTVTGRVGRSK